MLLSLTTSCGKDEAVPPSEQNGNQNGQGGNNQEGSTAPIIVTVDADGNADGGHRFVKIDDTNFYIDDIKYTATKGDLVVTGYNHAFFKGEATIISQLNYVGREMHVIEIGWDAFSRCTGLTFVTIPSSVTSIGMFAFVNSTALTDVYCYAEMVPNTDSYTFYESPISNATLHVPASAIDAYRNTSPWSGFGKIEVIQ